MGLLHKEDRCKDSPTCPFDLRLIRSGWAVSCCRLTEDRLCETAARAPGQVAPSETTRNDTASFVVAAAKVHRSLGLVPVSQKSRFVETPMMLEMNMYTLPLSMIFNCQPPAQPLHRHHLFATL